MKNYFLRLPLLSVLVCILTGCSIGDKSASLSVIYGTAAVLSLLLLIGCYFTVQKNRIWFILLFSSVLVVNIGYTMLALSGSLDAALWANRFSYLGSVFLPLAMLMILLNVTNTPYKKRLPAVLLILSTVVFLIAASPGVLDVYYKEVSFAVINGCATLKKVYGPLHPLYLIYLLGYFSAMVVLIVRDRVKKTVASAAHSVILAIAVFVNIGVWFIEQLTDIGFEMLSVSYIISELFLLSVHLVVQENQHLQELVKRVETAKQYHTEADLVPEQMLKNPVTANAISSEKLELFVQGLDHLTPTEKSIYDAHIARMTTKEILANLNIKENTLKYHNRNIYSKLGVSSRNELLEIHKHLQSLRTKL